MEKFALSWHIIHIHYPVNVCFILWKTFTKRSGSSFTPRERALMFTEIIPELWINFVGSFSLSSPSGGCEPSLSKLQIILDGCPTKAHILSISSSGSGWAPKGILMSKNHFGKYLHVLKLRRRRFIEPKHIKFDEIFLESTQERSNKHISEWGTNYA